MIFSPPDIDPLSRLQVSRGLLITTERWQHAQSYHRQRQNLHYQSLHQPGVVRGFEVCIIPRPAHAQREEMNRLWVRISPGIAIDLKGNPILLNTALEFGIDPSNLNANSTQGNRQTIYLVAQYVDPEKPQDADISETLLVPEQDSLPDKVQEDCRIVQRRIAELQPEDVELCRVQLRCDASQLHNATSVHFPGENTLDFRHRLKVCPRPQGVVRVAHMDAYGSSSTVQTGLQTLLQATSGLFPVLQGNPHLYIVSLGELNAPLPIRQTEDPLLDEWGTCHLTDVPHTHLLSLSVKGRERLRHYLHQGGVLFITADPDTQVLEDLDQELVKALADLEANFDGEAEETANLRSQLELRRDRVNTRINERIEAIRQQIQNFAQQVDYPLEGNGHIGPDHPLRQSPFTFASWPTASHQVLRLFCWNGIVLALGRTSDLWNPNTITSASRPDIRTAQEWGINLLHYAWTHHQLTQLQHGGLDHA
ncbi:MAG: hypothetical protein AAFY20_07620 [Cyanobacteria bacterium J06639_14]